MRERELESENHRSHALEWRSEDTCLLCLMEVIQADSGTRMKIHRRFALTTFIQRLTDVTRPAQQLQQGNSSSSKSLARLLQKNCNVSSQVLNTLFGMWVLFAYCHRDLIPHIYVPTTGLVLYLICVLFLQMLWLQLTWSIWPWKPFIVFIKTFYATKTSWITCWLAAFKRWSHYSLFWLNFYVVLRYGQFGQQRRACRDRFFSCLISNEEGEADDCLWMMNSLARTLPEALGSLRPWRNASAPTRKKLEFKHDQEKATSALKKKPSV